MLFYMDIELNYIITILSWVVHLNFFLMRIIYIGLIKLISLRASRKRRGAVHKPTKEEFDNREEHDGSNFTQPGSMSKP